MLPVKFDFKVNEDRRGTNFEGVEAGHADPEGALNLHLRVARDHLVLSVWPVRGEMAQVTDHLAQILGPPRIPHRSAASATARMTTKTPPSKPPCGSSIRPPGRKCWRK